jgi:hypothetical protein
MTIKVIFPDNHSIEGETPTEVLLAFLHLNERHAKPSLSYPLARAKNLMSDRVYDWCLRHVDTSLKPTAFLQKVAELGVIDIEWGGWRNLVDTSKVQGDGP